MTKNFEYTSEFDYHPHITIGYVKPKVANKYIRTLSNEYILIPSYYTYSFADGRKIKFKK